MKNILNTVRFQSERIISGEYENNILFELNQLEGIEGLHTGLDFVEIDYYPGSLSSQRIREALTKAFFDFRELPAKRSPGFLGSFIPHMARGNRKTLKSKGHSCCG